MQSEELKPCPFCGGSDVRLRHHQAEKMSWVSCVGCGLEAPTETGVSEADAVAYWNRRAEAALSTHVEAAPAGYRWTFDGGATWHYGADRTNPIRSELADEIQPLFAAPPAPSVAVKALHQAASDFMHLFIHDGQLTVQGLEDTDLIPAYEKLSAALSAQVQDVAGTEAIAALKEAEPYVEICHSLMTQKETRANVWRVLKQVRAAIAAAPAKQEGGHD